ncbi:MAG: bifunctional phosphopantothenoylcysteine decarboxylase/phosphopantothenate--cysteine ligase CoaBC [Desulfovibrio sp.]
MDTDLLFRGYLGKRVHLGVTGSVAAYKAIDLVRGLLDCNVTISATLTAAASRFITPLSFSALGADPVYGAMFSAGEDPYAHLGPGRACDLLAVVPCTANSMAKFACGIADDMLSCQVLAHRGPLLLAPAMNPAMWEAPVTRDNLERLRHRGVEIVSPGSGLVACGDVGNGRLAPVAAILAHALRLLSPQDLAGRKILLTLGPTREQFDAVRFWSNPSTGRMGASLAVTAWSRGADVTVVAGPCGFALPDDIQRIDVTSALEMHAAAADLWPGMDVACCTAAVADFRPRPFGTGKMKKNAVGTGGLNIAFDANPDILAGLGANKRSDQKLIGFAAETEDLRAQAQAKLERKNLDMIVANAVNAPDSGFASRTNRVLVVDRGGRMEEWPQLEKSEVAWRIWDHLVAI